MEVGELIITSNILNIKSNENHIMELSIEVFQSMNIYLKGLYARFKTKRDTIISVVKELLVYQMRQRSKQMITVEYKKNCMKFYKERKD